jgi:hypothetical protein
MLENMKKYIAGHLPDIIFVIKIRYTIHEKHKSEYK